MVEKLLDILERIKQANNEMESLTQMMAGKLSKEATAEAKTKDMVNFSA